jgi:hypothetical protein
MAGTIIAIAKSFFRLIIFIVGAPRAVPSDHRRARQAVPLQNEITFEPLAKVFLELIFKK